MGGHFALMKVLIGQALANYSKGTPDLSKITSQYIYGTLF